MKSEQWTKMKETNNWNEVELRDGRYNQVIHMVSAAKGAEDFYHIENHAARHEGMELARLLDDITSQVVPFDLFLLISLTFMLITHNTILHT